MNEELEIERRDVGARIALTRGVDHHLLDGSTERDVGVLDHLDERLTALRDAGKPVAEDRVASQPGNTQRRQRAVDEQLHQRSQHFLGVLQLRGSEVSGVAADVSDEEVARRRA